MSGSTIQLAGHAKETRRWARIEKLCKHYGASPSLYVQDNRQVIHIDRSAALRAVLSVVLAGRVAKDKHLASPVWGWEDWALRTIVEGYLEGDGSNKGSGRFVLNFTRNYALERDLRCLAARLGAALIIRPSHATIDDTTYPSFHGEWRWKRSGHHNEKPRAEVVEIRLSRARKFWDIAVADDPHTFAFASGVLSHNTNPMPESVTDRPTNAHEKVFLFAKSQKYFYDAFAVREEVTGGAHPRRSDGSTTLLKGHDPNDRRGIPPKKPPHDSIEARRARARWGTKRAPSAEKNGMRPTTPKDEDGRGAQLGREPGWRKSRAEPPYHSQYDTGHTGLDDTPRGQRNLRNVWSMTTGAGFPGAHFATFPPSLVEPCVKAGSSEKGACPQCGAPWVRIEEKSVSFQSGSGKSGRAPKGKYEGGPETTSGSYDPRMGPVLSYEHKGWVPSCDCATVEALAPVPAVVLDPFAGSGTVGLVADRLGRDAVLIEISPEYADMAKRRIKGDAPMFTNVTMEDEDHGALGDQQRAVR